MEQYNDVSSTSGSGVGLRLHSIIGEIMDKKADVKQSMQHTVVFAKPQVKPLQQRQTPVTAVRAKVKSLQYCGISSCGKRSEQLRFAPSHVLTYFGFKNRLAVVKVCSSCVEKANEYQQKSIILVKSGESLFNLKTESFMVTETIDLENEDVHEPEEKPQVPEEVEVDFDRKDVDGIVKQLLNKFKLQSQVESCTQKAMKEAIDLEADMNELEAKFKLVDDILYDTSRRYNKVFDQKPQPLVIQEVEINADGRIRRRNVAGDKTVFVNNSSLAKLAEKKDPETLSEVETHKEIVEKDIANHYNAEVNPKSDAKVSLNDSVISLEGPRKPGPASKTGYYENINITTHKGPFEKKVQIPPSFQAKKVTQLLPTPQIIPKVLPGIGDIVYAMNKNLLNYWLQAEVIESIRNLDTNQTEFIIKYEPTKNGKPTGGKSEEGDGSTRLIRQVCLKQLAYNVPCPFTLPVGTRVIAKFKDELNMDPETDGHYYAGVIAECPKPSAKNRYLIFFDDGYAQYVLPEGILLVCESSKEVWRDIYPESYDFIKDYVIKYPDWPLVRLHEGSLVTTEWNGKWLISRILEVDCSLTKVRFENDGREEWIYRGSPRLRPIYRCLEKEQEKKEKAQATHVPRHDSQEYRNRNAPTVEYQYDINTDNRSARKSTTGKSHSYDYVFGGLNSNHINMMDPDLCIEFQGTLTKIKIPGNVPRPKEYVPHTCNSDCVFAYEPTKELKRISPLAVPWFLGWSREVGRSRHVVFYRTPCGIRLRDFDELNKFLKKTSFNLSVDYFSYDYLVDCLSEFNPARSLVNIKDISYGKESAPVQCLNSVDYDTLPYMEYTPNRIPGPDVNINADENFLACCDCTDNCEDKSKCACWKLTMEGIAFTKLYDPNCPMPGYENRRLKDHIVSGIYECNSRCHCKSTCSNRVVQNGVKWPLQVFKTTKKGWGIRAVYDMPEGTFICIYAGQVLNDQTANEDGKEFGDEYLAELDYIECNEDVKANYESDVSDIEAEDDDDSLKRKRSRTGEDSASENSESEPEMDCHAGDTSFRSHVKVPEKGRGVAKRRTNGRKQDFKIVNNDEDILTAHSKSHFNPQVSRKGKKKRVCLRELYGPDEQCYIMDAKSKGNIGRYLNHSCKPNVFVQNVFFETQDVRFPLVAFFTNSFVKAGTELTWDYHYQIGSVPGKTMFCFCNTVYCRGRLL